MRKSAFTLVETLYALLLFGIFSLLIGTLFLEIYKNYRQQNTKITQQLHTQNALLQIKRIFENSHLQSIRISDDTPIANTPISLKSKTLMFYPKAEEFALFQDFALPCVSGIFEPKSLDLRTNLTLEFLQFDKNAIPKLNQNCKIFQPKFMPKIALLLTSNFNPPKDFYNPHFQGRILRLNAHSITLEIPPFLRQMQSPKIAPKIFILNQPSLLYFNDSVTLQNAGESPKILAKDLDDFMIQKHPLGLLLKLCTNAPEKSCQSTIVAELE